MSPGREEESKSKQEHFSKSMIENETLVGKTVNAMVYSCHILLNYALHYNSKPRGQSYTSPHVDPLHGSPMHVM